MNAKNSNGKLNIPAAVASMPDAVGGLNFVGYGIKYCGVH